VSAGYRNVGGTVPGVGVIGGNGSQQQQQQSLSGDANVTGGRYNPSLDTQTQTQSSQRQEEQKEQQPSASIASQ
jgi:hypothetical protein